MLDAGQTVTASRIGLDLAGPSIGESWYLVDVGLVAVASVVGDLCEALDGAGVAFERIEAAHPQDLLSDGPDRRPEVGALGWSAPVAICVPKGLCGLPLWEESAYSRMDRLRHKLRERWPRLVLVTDSTGLARIVHHAPHLYAFFEPAGRWSDGTMSITDVERHLEGLRAHHQLTDAEVLERAERGTLPQDADHHAWLILLGRGDLIPRPAGKRP